MSIGHTDIQAQVDGGSNSHIFDNVTYFHSFTQTKGTITQVTGDIGHHEGVGIVLIWIQEELIIPLYPCYLMKNNPQNTISTTAIKKYNDFRSVRIEALEWVRFTDANGKSVRVRTNQEKVKEEVLDYITYDIMTTSNNESTNEYVSIPSSANTQEHISDLLIPPTINHAFTKNEDLDQILLHRRLGHASNAKIDQMGKLGIMDDLPKRQSKSYKNTNCPCTICWKASTVNVP